MVASTIGAYIAQPDLLREVGIFFNQVCAQALTILLTMRTAGCVVTVLFVRSEFNHIDTFHSQPLR